MSDTLDTLLEKLRDYDGRTARSRRRPTTTRTKRWLSYAAAASAGVTAAAASDTSLASVVHSGPINRVLSGDDEFRVDVDDDGEDDFRFINDTYYGFTTTNFEFTDYWVGAVQGLNGEVAINPVGNYGYLAQLFTDAEINNGQLFGAFPTIRGHYLLDTFGQEKFYFGSFTGYGFAGVRFDINGNNHFGWIQLNVSGGAREYTVIDWAYENVPDVQILAGDMGMSVGVPGDYSGNGTVGPEDYDEWRRRFGTTAVPSGSGADGNSNGIVDAADYVLWRNASTSGAGSNTTGTVPEPSTVTLGVLALGAAGIAALRRRST